LHGTNPAPRDRDNFPRCQRFAWPAVLLIQCNATGSTNRHLALTALRRAGLRVGPTRLGGEIGGGGLFGAVGQRWEGPILTKVFGADAVFAIE
jgi:hypothetical protein